MKKSLAVVMITLASVSAFAEGAAAPTPTKPQDICPSMLQLAQSRADVSPDVVAEVEQYCSEPIPEPAQNVSSVSCAFYALAGIFSESMMEQYVRNRC